METTAVADYAADFVDVVTVIEKIGAVVLKVWGLILEGMGYLNVMGIKTEVQEREYH